MTKLQEYLNNITDKNKIEVITTRRSNFWWEYGSSELVWNFEGGDIDLSQFPNLKYLELSGKELYSPLTSLNLKGCNNLEKIIVPFNNLDSLNFLNKLINPTNLRGLDITSNNISTSDLKTFSKFPNLEGLKIGNNRFIGSLEPLKDLKQLKFVDYENTDIDNTYKLVLW